MNRLREAAAYLGTRLASRAGDAASYVRDAGLPGQATHPVTVVSGRERDVARDASRAEMFRQSGWDQDVLITSASFLATGLIEPVAGDRIVIGSETFEAILPNGERAWRYSDPTNALMRIHCRKVN